MKTLILGCGYLGQALARALSQDGDDVTGWVRRAESAEALRQEKMTLHIGDLSAEAAWTGVAKDFNRVIHCASSGRGGVESYRQVYREGTRLALAQQPQAHFIFVSSTSVYGQNHGEIVTEQSPAEPPAETSQVLREVEDCVLPTGGTVLRVAGIYGPGRGVLLRKFLQNEAVIEGDGLRWINQVHRTDIVRALQQVMRFGGGGEIYNVCDDEPVTHLTFYGWLAEKLGRPMPPHGPVNWQRKRGWTNKRVSNVKLKALDWQPRFPTFREGLLELL